MATKHRSVAYCLGKTTERGTLKESFVTGDQQHIETWKVHQGLSYKRVEEGAAWLSRSSRYAPTLLQYSS